MSVRKSAAVAATESPCPATRQQQAADAARGAARRIINIPAVLRVSVGLAVDPRVQPSEFNAARGELASSPHFHALHVLCRLAAHPGIIPGVSECSPFAGQEWTEDFAASRPAMRPKVKDLASPCWLNPPAVSPPQYNAGIACPHKSMTWAFPLMRKPEMQSWMQGIDHAA